MYDCCCIIVKGCDGHQCLPQPLQTSMARMAITYLAHSRIAPRRCSSSLFLFTALHVINTFAKLWLYVTTARYLVVDEAGLFAFGFIFLFFGFFEVSFLILYSRLFSDLEKTKTFSLWRHFKFLLFFWPFSFFIFALLTSALNDLYGCYPDILCQFIYFDLLSFG